MLLFCFTNYVPSAETRGMLGKAQIVILALFLLIHIALIVLSILGVIKARLKTCFSRLG